MKTFKALTQLSIIQAVLPLAISATLYLLGASLSYFSAIQSSHDPIVSSSGSPPSSLMKRLAQTIFQVYGNYFQFVSMMFLITIITKIKSINAKNLFQRSLKKEFLKRLFIYSLIYCFYQLIGTPFIMSLPDMTHFDPHFPSNRILVEEETKGASFQPNNEELSLSVGYQLNTLVDDATAMILSHDGKLLYAANFYSANLKIIDVSDIQTPTIISTMRLISMSMPKFGAFYLTKDGQTLFATDNHYLQIINVSNQNSPFLIGSCNDPNAFLNPFYRKDPELYKPMIEISQDQKTLFAGGLALQVFNISDLSNPTFISSTLGSKQSSSTSLAVSASATHLFFVHKALQIYDISSDSNKPAFVKNFTTNKPATSMILTHDKTIAYILCQSSGNQVTIEKVDVSNPLQPRRIKQYKPSLASLESPVIIAISPCDRYLFVSLAANYDKMTELRTFDTVEEKIISPIKSMIQTADAMVFIPNTSYLVSSSSREEKTRFFELVPNFTKRKVFSLSELKMKKYLLKDNANSLQFSSDRETTFLSTGHIYYQDQGTLEIFNAQFMTSLVSYSSDQPILKSFISVDKTKAVLQLYSKIEILDISDLSSPTLIDPPLDFGETNDISSLLVFKDASTAIVAFVEGGELEEQMQHVRFFSISDPLHITEFASLSIKNSGRGSRMVLSKNEKTLFLSPGRLIIYDLSNLKDPKQLANFSVGDGAATKRVLFCLLSPDEKILAVRIIPESDDVTKLKFYNVSNPKQPAFISEITLPEEQWENDGAENSAFSLDQKRVYISQIGSLLTIDISEIKTPKILGIVPNSAFERDNPVSCLSIEPDGNTANVLTETGYLYQMDLHLPEVLFMKQESFKLGIKYPNTLAVLAQNSALEYELLTTENYKLIKSHFLNFEVVKNQSPIKIANYSLHDWVTLENNALTIEAKSRSDINSHIFCSGFSYKIPISAFKEIEPKLPNTTDSKDLIATLISMGYLDSQLFITSNFGTFDSFYLPRLYRDFEQDIYQTINDYSREICTKFEITSSLELEIIDNKFSIKTPSTSSTKLQIELQPRGRFLSSSYGFIQPGVRKNSSIITIEDSLKEINLLLQQLVLDLPTSEPCSGTITVNDNLNYPLTKEVVNISKYFFENKKPVINQSMLLQDQINSFSIFTGQYFIININPKTFTDNYADKLSYSVVMNNKERSKIPSWLTFTYPDLKGTPPEDFMNRNFELLLIVKNEFNLLSAGCVNLDTP